MASWRGAVLLLTIALGMALCLSASAEETVWGMVDGSERVNLRQEPSSDAVWLGSYPQGTWVEVLGEVGSWYQVACPDNKVGYMSQRYVAGTTDRYGTVGIVTNPIGTSYLNLRRSPSYNAEVLGIYYNGVPCVLLSLSDGWYHVTVDGVEGYFRAEFITRSYQVISEKVATIVATDGALTELRSEPKEDADILQELESGTYVMVLQQGTDWWRVSEGGYVGFLPGSCLQEGVVNDNGVTPAESAYLDTWTDATEQTENVERETLFAVVANPRSTQVLNMRDAPSTEGTVLAQYSNGVQLEVLGLGETWCRVRSPKGLTGYMMTAYLTFTEEVSFQRTVDHPEESYVNLRAAPSLSSEVLTQVPHGSQITVLIPGEDWMQVRYGEMTGYMVAYFLN